MHWPHPGLTKSETQAKIFHKVTSCDLNKLKFFGAAVAVTVAELAHRRYRLAPLACGRKAISVLHDTRERHGVVVGASRPFPALYLNPVHRLGGAAWHCRWAPPLPSGRVRLPSRRDRPQDSWLQKISPHHKRTTIGSRVKAVKTVKLAGPGHNSLPRALTRIFSTGTPHFT
jgi:hypothetical protein